MRDKELYSKILRVETPWHVAHVELSITKGSVEVFLEHDGKKPCDTPRLIRRGFFLTSQATASL